MQISLTRERSLTVCRFVDERETLDFHSQTSSSALRNTRADFRVRFTLLFRSKLFKAQSEALGLLFKNRNFLDLITLKMLSIFWMHVVIREIFYFKHNLRCRPATLILDWMGMSHRELRAHNKVERSTFRLSRSGRRFPVPTGTLKRSEHYGISQ